MAGLIKTLLKGGVTVGIFVALFAEFGGGPVAVSRASIDDGSAFYTTSPDMPGIVGKLKAKLSGAKLPDPVPLKPTEGKTAMQQACLDGATAKPVFVKTTSGAIAPLKTLRHCENDTFTKAAAAADKELTALSGLNQPEVFVTSKGFQLVDIDFHDLWREITSVNPATFALWFTFAILVKLSGIMANIFRWKVLLDAQGVNLSFRWLNASYWVGRYWGIVTPSTMGLDGWRLYDTYRETGKPIECATALAVERLVGFVSLLGALLLILPFAEIGGDDFKSFLAALKLPVAASVVLGALFLLQPGWFSGLPRLVPHAKAQKFLADAIKAATAYSSNRTALVIAMACAVFGQFTTMFMYVGNAYALGIESTSVTQILAASAVMTFGTFIFPSASGEGVREFAFVWLLGGHTTAAKAFLIGHLGFWIEKLPLSLPGAFYMMQDRGRYKKITQEDLAEVRRAGAAQG